MMEGIIRILRSLVRKEITNIHTTELGIVKSVFPHSSCGDCDNYQCTVMLKNRKFADGSDFILKKVPVATPHMGFAAIPNEEDLVLINFIGGNINAPVITGRLYNDEDRPPLNNQKEVLLQHDVLAGGSLKIDHEGRVIIRSKDKKSIFTVEDNKIFAKNGGFQMTIDVNRGEIDISSPNGMKINAGGKLDLCGETICMQASQSISINGSSVTINGRDASRFRYW